MKIFGETEPVEWWVFEFVFSFISNITCHFGIKIEQKPGSGVLNRLYFYSKIDNLFL